VRTVEQPGSLKAWAQAELYAKVSGYLRSVEHQVSPELPASLLAHVAGALGTGPVNVLGGNSTRCAAGAHLVVQRTPELDIGSYVRAGETLMIIDVPELLQDREQKKAVWEQRRTEVDLARTAVLTADAGVRAAGERAKQADAEVNRAVSEHSFALQQYQRMMTLARDGTVTEAFVEEKAHLVNAAKANWQSCLAKVQALQAEQAVASSKLGTARADLLVKSAQVNVAWQDYLRAQLLTEYTHVHAPFNGVITYRGVDEGDFVQNSSSGQTRLLMTVSAIDKLRMVLDVPEREAVWIRAGSEATVRFDVRGVGEVKGRVSRTASSLDNQSRTLRVEIDLDNRSRRLMPGMYGHVTLTLQKIEGAQAIPATALYNRKREAYIIEVRDGVARRQRVRIRYDDGRQLEVVKLIGNREVPLDGSEELVVSNKGEIADGQRVKTARITAAERRPDLDRGKVGPPPPADRKTALRDSPADRDVLLTEAARPEAGLQVGVPRTAPAGPVRRLPSLPPT
jgi:RND family efflux transporter MFP subunit